MYPKNSAMPPKLFATVAKATDNTAITSGVAAKYSTGAGSQTGGSGTCQHEGNGQWSYAPTQAETNVDAFGIQFYHADAVGLGPTVSVVTSAGALVDIWTYASRTLTQLPAATSDGTASGAISRRRGDSWSISLTIGAITGYTSLWLTVKLSADDADTAALLMVKKNASGTGDGLLYANGAAASDASKASITVSDAATGAIIVAVDETVTDDMVPGVYNYDVQTLISGAVTTVDSGLFAVTADITKAVT